MYLLSERAYWGIEYGQSLFPALLHIHSSAQTNINKRGSSTALRNGTRKEPQDNVPPTSTRYFTVVKDKLVQIGIGTTKDCFSIYNGGDPASAYDPFLVQLSS